MLKKWRKIYNRGPVEDIILMSSKGIEKIFDGTTDIFGYKPDLTGISNSIMLTAKQHRQEIGKIVE